MIGYGNGTPCVCGDKNTWHKKCYQDQSAELKRLTKQRDELLAAAEAIEINSEECLDFDECTAMLVSIDDYHKLMEAVASVKGEQE